MENPYWLSLAAPQPAYLARIGVFAAGFGLLFVGIDRVVSEAEDERDPLQALSSPRRYPSAKDSRSRSGLRAATTLTSSVHASGTSLAAVYVVWLLILEDAASAANAVFIWQWALAFSQGYFLADLVLYGLRREAWVILHHLMMVIAHHPIGAPSLCSLMGLGDPSLAVWLSATGYLCEISTVCLNVRWFQIRWLKKHSILYSINGALLLVTYPVARIIGSVAILLGSLWPRWAEYRSHGLGSLVVFTSLVYIALILMSAYFFGTLISKGLSDILYFTPSTKKR